MFIHLCQSSASGKCFVSLLSDSDSIFFSALLLYSVQKTDVFCPIQIVIGYRNVGRHILSISIDIDIDIKKYCIYDGFWAATVNYEPKILSNILLLKEESWTILTNLWRPRTSTKPIKYLSQTVEPQGNSLQYYIWSENISQDSLKCCNLLYLYQYTKTL